MRILDDRTIGPRGCAPTHLRSFPIASRLLVFCSLLVFALCPRAGLAASSRELWTPTWATAPETGAANFNNQTVRMIVRSTIGGDRVRIRLSNLYGTESLSVGAAHIALRQQGSKLVPGTDRVLTFGDKPTIVIPPGASVLSDPATLVVPPLGDLAVTVYVPGAVSAPTAHLTGLSTTYISPAGDFTGAAEMPPGSTDLSYYWLTEVYVASSRQPRVVVAFGDSITDGTHSTPNTNSSWPGVLGKLLLTQKRSSMAVLNEGISGNRLLHDGAGTNALARFGRDAIGQPGVSTVILLEGINDIGRSNRRNSNGEDQSVTSGDLIQAMQQLIARCHMHNIKIFGATLTPYTGAAYFSDAGETTREAVNQWIRTSGAFDGVVDFDKVTEDPAQPNHFLAAYDSGDHLHPSDAGYQAMAAAAAQVIEHMGK